MASDITVSASSAEQLFTSVLTILGAGLGLVYGQMKVMGLQIAFKAQQNMVRVHLDDHEDHSNHCLKRIQAQEVDLVIKVFLAKVPSFLHQRPPRTP